MSQDLHVSSAAPRPTPPCPPPGEGSESDSPLRLRSLCATALALLAICVMPSRAPAEQAHNHSRASDPADSFRWNHEQFFYSLRVNGAEAMRATLKAGATRTNGKRSYVPLGLGVRSFGFFDNVYSVNDRADTYMNPRTLRPYRSEKHFREAGKSSSYIVDYAHQVFRAKVKKRRSQKTRRFFRAVPATTHDMITWLYDLRRRHYQLGDTFRYFVYDGWKLSFVTLTVIGKEDLYTPAGWFKAWKFKFVRQVMKSRANKQGGKPAAPVLKIKNPSEHHGYFWLSRDQNHLPLRITIPTSFGAGEAVLIKYNRHRN